VSSSRRHTTVYCDCSSDVSSSDLYAHPVEGVAAHVNLTTGKVLNFVDIDRNAPVSRENADLNSAATMPHRAAPAPLEIKQASARSEERRVGKERKTRTACTQR